MDAGLSMDGGLARDAGPDASMPGPQAFTPLSTLPRHCNQGGWCGARQPLLAVWGRAADDVWVVGKDETQGDSVSLQHYDGQHWLNTPHLFMAPYQTLRAISGAGSDVWFVGDEDGQYGIATRWDGETFHAVYTLFGSTRLDGVFVRASEDVWGVGTGGAIGRYRGQDWQLVDSKVSVDLHGVWASAEDDAWVVGDDATILRWNGKDWTRVAAGVPAHDLLAVWGSAADDVWAVGAARTILRFDGSSWQAQPFDLTTDGLADFTSVFGRAGRVWVTSSDGQLFVWDGSAWASEPVQGLSGLRGVWVADDGELWAVGEQASAAHRRGKEWRTTPGMLKWDLHGLWGSAADDLWLVGVAGTLVHWNGSAFSKLDTFVHDDLYAVHGSSRSDVWAVGDQILHLRGDTWSVAAETPEAKLRAVWALGEDDAWAAAENGAIYHWNGAAWSVHARFPEYAFATLWASGPDDVWAMDRANGGVHWDGKEWSDTLTSWGGGYYDQPTSQVFTGTARDDVWLAKTFHYASDGGVADAGMANDAGADLHPDWLQWQLYDGLWRQPQEETPFAGQLNAAWSPGRRVLWVAGTRLRHAAGGVWDYPESYVGLDVIIHALWGASPDDLWAVGEQGTILHKEPVVIVVPVLDDE
jgi:hypothetical protein